MVDTFRDDAYTHKPMTRQGETNIHIRLSKREQSVIDAEKKRLETENPGTRISKGDAVRSLILRAGTPARGREARE